MGCSGLLAAGLVRSYLALLGIIRPKNYGSADERGVNKRNWDFTSSGKRARSSTAAPKRFIWARKQTNQPKNNPPASGNTKMERFASSFCCGAGITGSQRCGSLGLGANPGGFGALCESRAVTVPPRTSPRPRGHRPAGRVMAGLDGARSPREAARRCLRFGERMCVKRANGATVHQAGQPSRSSGGQNQIIPGCWRCWRRGVHCLAALPAPALAFH